MFHILRIYESFTHEGVKWNFFSTNDQAYPPSQFMSGRGRASPEPACSPEVLPAVALSCLREQRYLSPWA